jgi:Ca2+/Na+ antiporter
MIRHKATYIAINAVGAAATASSAILIYLNPSPHPTAWYWVSVALSAIVFAAFLYNIARRMKGPIEPSGFMRHLSDRQLWLVKGTLLLVVAVIAIVIIISRFFRV